MKAIVFNHEPSKIDYASDSVSLRVGYLLCDAAIIAGTTHRTIFFDVNFNTLRTDKKLDALDAYYSRQPDEDSAERVEEIREYKRMYSVLSKVKHPPPAIIKRLKQSDKVVDKLFVAAKAEMLEKLMGCGLPQLKSLYQNFGFDVCQVDSTSPEINEEGFTPASKVLQPNVPEGDAMPEIFCIPSSFFQDDFFSQWTIAGSSSDKNAHKNDGYLQHCFIFPNLNHMSAAQLEAVHKQLNEPSGLFREKVNQWIVSVLKGENPEDTSRFFTEDILPATAPVCHALAENEILEEISRVNFNAVELNVFYGELPLKVVWEFYKFFGTIKDETWTKLAEVMAKDDFKNKRVPVIVWMQNVLTEEKTEAAEENKEEDETVKPVKKYISID